MASILVVCYDTSSGKYLAQLAGSAQIADGAITSGKFASGIIGTVHLRDLNVTSAKLATAIIDTIIAGVADEGVTSAKLASGAVGGDRVWYGGIVSAHIGATEVGTPHLAAGAVTSGKVGVGEIGGVLLQNAGVISGKVGANAIGGDRLWDFGLVSGKYSSGSITEQALVSGISIDISEISQEPSYRAAALISGFLGVQFSVSGYFNYAQAAAVGTMPAVGLAIANIASGAIGTFQHQGRIINAAWDFSGYVGELVFMGTSSQVTLTAPSASGECVQRVGKVVDKVAVFLKPELSFVQIAE